MASLQFWTINWQNFEKLNRYLPEPNMFLCNKAFGEAGIRFSFDEVPAMFKLFNDSGLYGASCPI